MKKSFTLGVAGGLLSLCLSIGPALADGPVSETVTSALAAKNLSSVQDMLAKNPKNTDEIVKALLKNAQTRMATDPEFTGKMMTLAGSFAEQITPPSVPAICADLRRVVEAVPIEQIGTPVFEQVMDASQKFSDAPVVVAQGRPNLCEEALLAQSPGMRAPNVSILRRPPFNPSDPKKPSAD